jgi:hypothetical protein
MSIIGKTKKEEFNRDDARAMSVRVAKRSNPLMSQKRAEKLVAKEEKRQKKRAGLGL